MNTKRLLLLCILILLSMMVWGQSITDRSIDSLHNISFSGSLDTYYHKAFKTDQDAPRTSFANLPGFSLGMINFAVEYFGKKTGFVADLVFGPRGADAIFNAPRYKNPSGGGSSHMINQMFVYFNLNKNVRLNAGQFNTFFGYETISPTKNIHYSTSYVFSYGPFNHTGIWADLKFGDHCSAKLALMNPTDYTEFNPFNLYTVGGQLSVGKTNAMLNFNVTYGDPDGHIQARDSIGSVSAGNAFHLDLTGTLDVHEKYSIGLSSAFRSIGSGQVNTTLSDNITLERCGFFGLALYQTLTIAPSAKIALRSEHFTEFNGGVGAIGKYAASGGASVFAFTLSGNIKRSNVRLIPEIRIDKTSTRSFTKSSTGKSVDQMLSVNAAVIYQIPASVHQIKL